MTAGFTDSMIPVCSIVARPSETLSRPERIRFSLSCRRARPRPVRDVVEDRTHPLLAFLQRDLGALALDEFANLRTDVVHDREQTLIELARRPRVERDHPDDPPAAAYRETDDSLEAGREGGGRTPVIIRGHV